jgi:hypothetical protein
MSKRVGLRDAAPLTQTFTPEIRASSVEVSAHTKTGTHSPRRGCSCYGPGAI